MSKKKRKQVNKDVKYNETTLTKEQMIEIQAEAYYRALMRVENEKKASKISDENYKKDKWYMNCLFVLNVWFFPWIINKHFGISNRIYDNILVLFVSLIMKFLGVVIWLIGCLGIAYNIRLLIIGMNQMNDFSLLMFGLFGMMIGSILFLAGKEFGREEDSNKIYAYSACIIAIVSCIFGIIAVFK